MFGASSQCSGRHHESSQLKAAHWNRSINYVTASPRKHTPAEIFTLPVFLLSPAFQHSRITLLILVVSSRCMLFLACAEPGYKLGSKLANGISLLPSTWNMLDAWSFAPLIVKPNLANRLLACLIAMLRASFGSCKPPHIWPSSNIWDLKWYKLSVHCRYSTRMAFNASSSLCCISTWYTSRRITLRHLFLYRSFPFITCIPYTHHHHHCSETQ